MRKIEAMAVVRARKKKTGKVVSSWLSEETVARIEAVAKREGLSRNAALNQLIDFALDADDAEQVQLRAKR